MKFMDRRGFLTTAAAAVTLPTFCSIAQASTPLTASVKLRFDEPGAMVPHNFIGLSYETQQLSDPTFFSAANHGLIAQFRALAPHGVLRLGGNTSDYGFWKPTATSTPPPRAKREYKVGDPPPDLSYAVAPEAVRNLRSFLDATGWTCLYGINLGTNIPALAAAEAEFVNATLGQKLEYFQIGNEADRFGATIRDLKTWNADAFLDEWLVFAKAILERVPNAHFGLPDIASNELWFSTIGDRLASDPIRSHVACLTHHYYIGGPPSNPSMTIERILRPDPHVTKVAGVVRAAATKLNTAWRMTEGNTCYRGGKPGVSDVFAASLWAADYMLTLASLGYAGVNLHGGDGQMVANSLGGRLPGDDMVKDDPANHPHPYYTPIAHIGSKYLPEPVYFGMLVAQNLAGAQMIPVELDPVPANVSAFAARRPNGDMFLVIINKDEAQSLSLRLPATPRSHRLTYASSLSSSDVKVQELDHSLDAEQTIQPHSISTFGMPPIGH